MVSEKLLSFANEFSRTAELGLYDPKFEVDESISTDLPLYSDEELEQAPSEGIEPYSDEELEERLRHVYDILSNKKAPIDKSADRLVSLLKIAGFDPAVEDLIKYINGVETAFIGAREGTDDPLAKVILTGMWQDFLNFKHEKWKGSFQMLAQQAQEVA